MWFKNLQLYRLPENWKISLDDFEKMLEKKRFQHCSSQEMESRGWLSPVGDDTLIHSVGGHWLITLGIESRLLPSSVVKQVAHERADELAEQQGYKLSRKQMKELQEQVRQELTPQAFTRRYRMNTWIDPIKGWLVVDASSSAKAENVLEHLRQTLDHFPLSLLRTERSPASVMASWLAEGEASAGFTIDQECELRSVTEDKAVVRYVRHTLDGDEIKTHLEAGKMPTRLALTFDERVSFILTEKLEIKKLDFLDVIRDQLNDQEGDATALFDAEFSLMTGELSHLLPAIVEGLGGELKAPDKVAFSDAPF